MRKDAVNGGGRVVVSGQLLGAWQDYAAARLARASKNLDEVLSRTSLAAVPAMHMLELESAAREAAEVIKMIRRNEQ